MNEHREVKTVHYSPLRVFESVNKAIVASKIDPNKAWEVTKYLPDEAAHLLIPLPDGIKLLDFQGQKLKEKAKEIHSSVAEVAYTVAGSLCGEYLATQKLDPNPELEARLQEYSLTLRRQCSEPIRTTRVIGYYRSLSALFQNARAELREMEMSAGCPDRELVDRDEDIVTTPSELDQLGLLSVSQTLEKSLSEFKGSLKTQRRPGETSQLTIPKALHPMSHGEAMQLIWQQTEKVTNVAGALLPDLTSLCLTVMRTSLSGRHVNRWSSWGDFAVHVNSFGSILTNLLEDACRMARRFWNTRLLSDASSINDGLPNQ